MTDDQIAGACLIGAVALAIAWILSWSLEESRIEKPWRWGDAPRRSSVPVESIVTHIVGMMFALMCIVFVGQRLGIG